MTIKIENKWLAGDQPYDNWGTIGAAPPPQATRAVRYTQEAFNVMKSREAAYFAARNAEQEAEVRKARLARPGKIAWKRRRLRRTA